MSLYSRRSAMKLSAAAVTAPLFLPSRLSGANGKLNIGVIGVGGRGRSDLAAVSTETIAAVCDVDEQRLAAVSKQYPNARTYHDYRQLLDQEDLDAVVVATPDHNHAPATVRALKRGLHVYCEKPLTHTVQEARVISQIALEQDLATQMGTQNHEHPGYVSLVTMLNSGVIGDVKEVHIITNRPGRWWTQGMDLPSETPAVPEHLHWDLWLGPADERSYHQAYVPFRWRGWWDFGCGAIGDMAIHLMDPAFQALKLGGRPVKVFSEGPPPNEYSGPRHMKTTFTFPAQGKKKQVVIYWYEGMARPANDIQEKLPMNGSLFVGSKGEISIAHGKAPQVLNADTAIEQQPLPTFSDTHHHQQWINACKTKSATGSNFGYAGPFTEVVLLGNVAYRRGRTISYDPVTMSTGDDIADALLRKDYRDGWHV
ncbi:MAG: Gfo/Idh/MocA family oxidoreductase [Fuerstiella sp.]|nr:Gfo/Idh/MocA family oxidoreductase [Fuerstiella sp.]